MSEILTNKASLIDRIQKDYKSALEKSSDVIGLDPHEILYKSGEAVNILTLDDCCDFLESAAHISMLKILKGIDSHLFNPNEVKAYVDCIRPEVAKYDMEKARKGLVLPEPLNKESKAPVINGRIILGNFHYSFNKELCDAYDKCSNPKYKQT